MADERPEKEEEVTPKGAVEVSEEDLDQAAGGVSSGGDMPVETVSLNYGKIEIDYIPPKPTTQNPGFGDKKI